MNHLTAARILIVDDEQSFRQQLGDNLEKLGYVVSFADSCATAKHSLMASSYALAIVDLHMENFDGDVTDDAGVDLVKYIHDNHHDVPVIIATNYANWKTLRRTAKLGAADYLDKTPDELGALGDKIANNIKRNLSLRIERPPGQAELREYEREIMQKLFLTSTVIRVHDFTEGSRGARLYRVDSRDADGTWIVPFMAKIGWRDAVAEELTRFQRYAAHKIPNSRYPEIVSTAFAGRHGGIACAFVGGFDLSRAVTLREYYRKHSATEVKGIFDRIFPELFRIWHENKGNKQPINLFDEYEGLLFEVGKLESAVSTYLKGYSDGELIRIPELGYEFRNPILAWRNLKKSYDVRTYLSTVHGDLNGGNVLIDQGGNLWLIDFERTSRGHIVMDHAELEIVVKYSLLEGASMLELAELERHLTNGPNLFSPTRLRDASESIRKALQVIVSIRSQAEAALAPLADPIEYFIALLYFTLNCLRFSNREISADKKKVLLYSASILLERIEKQMA